MSVPESQTPQKSLNCIIYNLNSDIFEYSAHILWELEGETSESFIITHVNTKKKMLLVAENYHCHQKLAWLNIHYSVINIH